MGRRYMAVVVTAPVVMAGQVSRRVDGSAHTGRTVGSSGCLGQRLGNAATAA